MNGYPSAAGQVQARESPPVSKTNVLPLSYTTNLCTIAPLSSAALVAFYSRHFSFLVTNIIAVKFRRNHHKVKTGCGKFTILLEILCTDWTAGAGSASRMLLYLSCPDLKASDVYASLRELNVDRRHIVMDQLLMEGRRCD